MVRLGENEDGEKGLECLCGNTTAHVMGSGFVPCDPSGNEVELTDETWTTHKAICPDCGRIFDVDTLEILGVNEHPILL